MSAIFEQFLDRVEKAASETIKVNEGDYVLNGVYHCGKCNTPKQKIVNLFGKERKPMCLCKCAAERLQAEEEERKRREFMLRVEKLRNKAFPDERMKEWTFAHDDKKNEKVSTIAERYVENFQKMFIDGKGLLFFGTTGTGKTFTAACIANALIDRGIACLVTNFARIGNTMQGTYDKQEYLDSFNSLPLLVLDDLGIERTTPYMQEIVYNVVDARCRAGLPLIVTTNLTSEELKNADEIAYQRIYSRLFECCIPIEVKGTDRRRAKLKQDFKEYNDLLGL